MDSALNEALEQINQFAGAQQGTCGGGIDPAQIAQNLVRRTGPRLNIIWAIVVVAVISSLAVVILLLLKKQRLLTAQQQQQQQPAQPFQQSVLPNGYEALLQKQQQPSAAAATVEGLGSPPFSSRWSAKHDPERETRYAGAASQEPVDENFTPLSQTIGRRTA